MDLKALTDPQKHALVDLAMLAMHADEQLAPVEDERIHRLLGAMGFSLEYERSKEYNASATRIQGHAGTEEKARAHAAELAKAFSTRDERLNVREILTDLVISDRRISPNESRFLSLVHQALQI
jgi:uncharacterized tellurite resistance protein B-like protein